MYYGIVGHIFNNIIKYHKPTYPNYWSILINNQFNTTCVYRKIDYDKIGGYNEELDNKEDWDFYIRLLYKDKKIFIDDCIAFYYRHREGSRDDNSKGNKIKYYNILKNINKEIFEEYEKSINRYNNSNNTD